MTHTLRLMIAANLLGLGLLGAALWFAQPFDTGVDTDESPVPSVVLSDAAMR